MSDLTVFVCLTNPADQVLISLRKGFVALTADWLSQTRQDAAMRWIGCTPLTQTDMIISLK